ncbi:phenoloxidase-activating factor 1-like [Panulirus ornatus]|uniref:phenoloxidase-activating factor 1-like n=1 Tax=Panulirus ornatus TaxID=150431 RepID=UPI003A849FC0
MVLQRVTCSPGLRRPTPLLLLLLLLVQLAATQNAQCSYQCTPLSQCPDLAQLIKNPTRENILYLRQRTCSKGDDPLVCCPQTTVASSSSLLPKDCGQGSQLEMIFGGTQAPIYSHPWIAALGYLDPRSSGMQFLCAGSVINERYVLTAASCVRPANTGIRKLDVIRLGDWDLITEVDCEVSLQGFKSCAPPAQNFTYEELIIHPSYDTRGLNSDDIALIRLSRPIDFSRKWIQPVCLPPQGLDVRKAAGQKEALVAGWGRTENGSSSRKLLQVTLPFFDERLCNETYRGNLIDGQLCFGGRKNEDSCSGDSGGPLVMSGPNGPPFLQIGIVSFGPVVCGREGHPAVYTSVSHYRDWIEKTLRP